MEDRFDAVNIAMVYLLAVVIIALGFSRGAALACAGLCVAAFDFFFVPPKRMLAVADMQYFVTFAIMAVPFVLVVRQPDLGTALVLVPVAIAILVGIGVRLRVLGMLAAAGVSALPLFWFVLKPYQRDRLLVYLDPFRDPLGTAYNVIQAKIAIGSGQLFGKGPSGATQSRLAFLPERHTDFIFAVFAEMWGFIGCLVLIAAYGLLVLRGFEIAASAREPRGRILALGVTAVFATQTLVNLGMVTGLLPVVGIPLPLMSYGGSSMVVSLMGLGLLLSIRMRQFY